MNMVDMGGKVDEKRHSKSGTSGENNGDGGGGVRMVLWTRRPVCGSRTEIIDRLSALRSSGAIDTFAVQTWPDEVVLSEQTRHDRLVETYQQFREWAEGSGLSIAPPFERRTVTTLVGRREEVLTVPMLCLAVYDDGLCGVYPCSDGDRTWTVPDYLDAYEAAGGRPVGVATTNDPHTER